jgi:pyridoxine/pyridoxamine 5'-phosphate oxidase
MPVKLVSTLLLQQQQQQLHTQGQLQGHSESNAPSYYNTQAAGQRRRCWCMLQLLHIERRMLLHLLLQPAIESVHATPQHGCAAAILCVSFTCGQNTRCAI